MKVQYSLDESTWNDLTSAVGLDAVGTSISTKTAIPTAAKTTSTYLRLITISGSGASDANARFGNVSLNIYNIV